MINYRSYLSNYNLLTDTISMGKLNNIINHIMFPMNTIFTCGNGGSFSTAQHFAQDLTKLAGCWSECLGSNPSQLTATANDDGYEHIFSYELIQKAGSEDLLVVISCSGNSKNIVEAAKFYSKYHRVVGLLGCDGGEVAQYCTESIIIPSRDFGMIESIHSLLCHYIVTEIHELFETL